MLGRKRKTITLDREKFIEVMSRLQEAEKLRPTINEIVESAGYKPRNYYIDLKRTKEKKA